MIKYTFSQQPHQEIKTNTLVLAIFSMPSNPQIKALVKTTGFCPDIGNTQSYHQLQGFAAKQVILWGLGEKKTLSKTAYQKALKELMALIKQQKIDNLALSVVDIDVFANDDLIALSVQTIDDSQYQFTKPYKEKEQAPLKQVILHNHHSAKKALAQGQAIASGMALTRQLADLPSNICTPSYLADTAKQLAKKYQLDCQVLDEKQMQKHKMAALLSVSKGSVEPAKLICLHYKNAGKEKPIVLVGKGVTFDSGGISLKPGAAMDEMKYDMCGAASVLGVMKTVAMLKAKVNLSVVIAAVENMPSANASKPGDIVQSMSGQTIEILNTDAEGRLILCDALTYCARFKPKVVIDIATLTGAVIIALGKLNSGLMSNDKDLASALVSAGTCALDGVWQLPLADGYDELLKSNFADMANIGGREAGSITAACFLSRFTKDYRWAHLDIAGSAWLSGGQKGATGRPVPLLVHYILQQL